MSHSACEGRHDCEVTRHPNERFADVGVERVPGESLTIEHKWELVRSVGDDECSRSAVSIGARTAAADDRQAW